MGEKIQLKRGIYKVNFGYHSKRGGYMTLMLDIQELSEINALGGLAYGTI
ncbi:MAG: hypothetical protein KAT65_20780 [Methanophagales archaeon]|nr:hypothetical protein [Methanophagales archaeon]